MQQFCYGFLYQLKFRNHIQHQHHIELLNNPSWMGQENKLDKIIILQERTQSAHQPKLEKAVLALPSFVNAEAVLNNSIPKVKTSPVKVNAILLSIHDVSFPDKIFIF